MQELRLSIKRMVDRLFPWHHDLLVNTNEDYVSTSQLIEAIDALVYQDDNPQVRLCNHNMFH